ncbi:hypothetical protein [Desulfofundulus thermocisternus]|jgi:hypothetical protein|uniref:hypothetical protein n=1 Tax=Desulfofundulus thermocisternus TaxID=42471 RepID=UPI001A00B8EC|nr:hypothetical protein [Desulfofundulus thermocisternus]MBE3584627.1 hypothetical protein [Thermoanaerobacter sp.]MCS5696557.1 hypothetical protein [Desulfofundulus thermocisternus]
MNARLLFVVHSPGGANFAAPLVREFAARNLPGVRYDVALLSPWAREIVGEGFDVAPEPEAVMRVVE